MDKISKQTKLSFFMKNFEVSETDVEEVTPSMFTRNTADDTSCDSPLRPVLTKQKVVYREHDPDYIKHGSTCEGNSPLCVIWPDVLSNSAMFPAKLKRPHNKKSPSVSK
jgi:hypothetical protein